MRISPVEIREANVSTAWLRSLQLLLQLPGHEVFHLTVRISDVGEDPEIRREADKLLRMLGLQSIDTVRNTIFPAELARSTAEPADLAKRYRALYSRLRKVSTLNGRGTYFGRLVELPTPPEPGWADQLSSVVFKLRNSVKGRQRFSSIYEIDMSDAGNEMAVYVDRKDRRVRRGFPCLSFCSFHLDGPFLHLTAHYRSQYIVARGYGNFLGLKELQQYIAGACGLKAGELLVTSGHASIELGIAACQKLVNKTEKLVEDRRGIALAGKKGL